MLILITTISFSCSSDDDKDSPGTTLGGTMWKGETDNGEYVIISFTSETKGNMQWYKGGEPDDDPITFKYTLNGNKVLITNIL